MTLEIPKLTVTTTGTQLEITSGLHFSVSPFRNAHSRTREMDGVQVFDDFRTQKAGAAETPNRSGVMWLLAAPATLLSNVYNMKLKLQSDV